MFRSFSVILFLFLFNSVRINAQDHNKMTRILFVLDCSGSMWQDMGSRSRMEVARSILSRMVDSLKSQPNVELAVRAYGHRSAPGLQDCRDTRLEVGFEPGNAQKIKDAIGKLKPNGTTPIAYSLTQSANDFPSVKSKNIVILITDGEESCGMDPCAVSLALQNKNIILKPFIIGIGLSDEAVKAFSCVGRTYNTKTEADFGEILGVVVSQALNNTTAQVMLNDIHGKPTETNVNMTFYNSKNNSYVVNYYHTMYAGKPDTFRVEPTIKYDLQIHTTPPVFKRDISIAAAKHNIITVDAPQGELQLSVAKSPDIKCLVRRANQSEIIHVQGFNNTQKYLVGNYDLEILTLPRIFMNDVKITQSHLNKIEIPQAGRLELAYRQEMVASIFVLRNNQQEWVADIAGITTPGIKESFHLQPGNYKIVYRKKNDKKTTNTSEKDFSISSGISVPVSID